MRSALAAEGRLVNAGLELAIVAGASAVIGGIVAAVAGSAMRPVFGRQMFIELEMKFVDLC